MDRNIDSLYVTITIRFDLHSRSIKITIIIASHMNHTFTFPAAVDLSTDFSHTLSITRDWGEDKSVDNKKKRLNLGGELEIGVRKKNAQQRDGRQMWVEGKLSCRV